MTAVLAPVEFPCRPNLSSSPDRNPQKVSCSTYAAPGNDHPEESLSCRIEIPTYIQTYVVETRSQNVSWFERGATRYLAL